MRAKSNKFQFVKIKQPDMELKGTWGWSKRSISDWVAGYFLCTLYAKTCAQNRKTATFSLLRVTLTLL
jgi:hypothetical protein